MASQPVMLLSPCNVVKESKGKEAHFFTSSSETTTPTSTIQQIRNQNHNTFAQRRKDENPSQNHHIKNHGLDCKELQPD